MIRPKKHLGQHFLHDENIARKIAGLVPPGQVVLEIGPGMGILSKYLMEDKAIETWFMEIDHESVEYLKNRWPEWKDRILAADFLQFDLSGFPIPDSRTALPLGSVSGPPFVLIGNFPYNISSQILFRAVEFRNRIPLVIGMFQKEVAERIAAPPGNKTYGILSVLIQAWYTPEYLFTVSETVFHPPPKVKSAVIKLTRNQTERLDCNEALFIRIVKTAFNQRRKTLRNALRGIPGIEKILAKPIFDKRAEQLGVDDFVRLAAEISTFA
jgi:16S rRNA (adenine1518-N6/adenine1519-N6)-dimethyltransferase